MKYLKRLALVILMTLGVLLTACGGKESDGGGTFEDGMSEDGIRVFVLGHVGHGKTELVQALSKFYGDGTVEDPREAVLDQLPIHVSRVPVKTGEKKFVLYDFADYWDAIKGLVEGTEGLDAAILVVNTYDGTMAQTREEIKLLSALHVGQVVVFLNNYLEVAEADEILGELVCMELQEQLADQGFDPEKIVLVKGSAAKANAGDADGKDSVEQLMKEMARSFDKVTREREETVTSFPAYVYLLQKEEGGLRVPVFATEEVTIKLDDVAHPATMELPKDVEMAFPGNYAIVNVKLEGSVKLALGDVFYIYKEDTLIGVGKVCAETK